MAHLSHKQVVVGSIPSPATKRKVIPMSKFEFLVETIYQEVVEVEADTLEDAEDIVRLGEGAQVDMVNVSSIILSTREFDSEPSEVELPELELEEA